jgi:trans-aconitate methyltransferase
MVLGAAAWHGVTVRSVLDLGAGTGLWRSVLHDEFPRVRYHGVDASPHACRRYGHELADLATWTPRRAADVVICQSVLQYLPDRDCEHAIASIGRACRGVLYLEVPTTDDFATVIDAERTDLDVHRRSGRWYRRRLAADFDELGAGMWVARARAVPLFELERPAR